MISILLLADTHLGFDMPLRPRVERRRRGPDFFRNFELALGPALRGEVDLVVHGGDLLYRSRVGAWLVDMAMEPLKRVADRGVPVVVVPGNHERSRIPYPILAAHPNLHLVDRPKRVRFELNGETLSLFGFPSVRNGVRDRFPELLRRAGFDGADSSLKLLAMHQTVEGARVGPVDYTFRYGPDIVRGGDIPDGFAAVLAGHIHRHQILTRDLGGREMAAPVFYPGSIERTSLAEKNEPKGYLVLRFDDRRLIEWRFHELPTSPTMVDSP